MTSYKATENKSTKAITFAAEQQYKILGHHLYWAFHPVWKKPAMPQQVSGSRVCLHPLNRRRLNRTPGFPLPGTFGVGLLWPTKPSPTSQLWGGEGRRERQGKPCKTRRYMHLPALLNLNSSLYCSETTAKKVLREELKHLTRMTMVQVWQGARMSLVQSRPTLQAKPVSLQCTSSDTHQIQ